MKNQCSKHSTKSGVLTSVFKAYTLMTCAHTTCMIIIIIIIVVVVIIIINPVITFLQGMYNYTPITNHVSRVYSVAAVLYLQFVLHVMLFHP